MSDAPYNPLEKIHLAENVVRALLRRPCEPLPPPAAFVGAGIYALYYAGPCPYYVTLAEQNRDECSVPIYVGKAIPPGRRRGLATEGASGTALYNRLREHAQSIRQVVPDQEGSLRLEDFRCRYLVTDDIWIPLGESLLVKSYTPVWNSYLDGFGDHHPGGGRLQGQRPAWDVLHPGRAWADQLQPNRRSRDDIVDDLRAALSGMPPPSKAP